MKQKLMTAVFILFAIVTKAQHSPKPPEPPGFDKILDRVPDPPPPLPLPPDPKVMRPPIPPPLPLKKQKTTRNHEELYFGLL